MKTKIITTANPGEFIELLKKYYKKMLKWNDTDKTIDELTDIYINRIGKHNNDVILYFISDTLDVSNASYHKATELAEQLTYRYYEIEKNRKQTTDERENNFNSLEQYHIIELLPKLIRKNAYPVLIDALKNNPKEEHQYNAMKQLSLISGQKFDRNLPKSYSRYDKKIYIRMDEIEQWIADGCPDGEGYPPPKLDASLENPATELEQLAAKLNNKIKPEQDNKDFSSYTNFLVVADKDKIEHLQNKYQLKGQYLEFLTRFSPCNVIITKGMYEVTIYGADILEERQIGYSVSDKGEVFDDWPSSYLVIADRLADPYCIDITKENSKIYIANHGEGFWKFRKAFNSFEDFLQYLAK